VELEYSEDAFRNVLKGRSVVELPDLVQRYAICKHMGWTIPQLTEHTPPMVEAILRFMAVEGQEKASWG